MRLCLRTDMCVYVLLRACVCVSARGRACVFVCVEVQVEGCECVFLYECSWIELGHDILFTLKIVYCVAPC